MSIQKRGPEFFGSAGSFSPETVSIFSQLTDFLHRQSVPAFLVGGSIRDTLRGSPTKDIDVAVLGDPLSLARSLADAWRGAYVPLDEARGVARVVVPSTEHRSWVVDLAALQGSIHDDLGRRDFTVDAMALDMRDWHKSEWRQHVIDPFGGMRDLAGKTVRAIGPSVFREDPLRLIRAVRLAASLKFSIEPDTAAMITGEARLIDSVAGERVRDELLAVLSSDGANKHLEMLDELGLLCCIIPEFEIMKGVEQPKEHYWDVFVHSIEAVRGLERVVSGDADDEITEVVPWNEQIEERFAEHASDGHDRRTMLKLAALLHDIAKPQTKMVDAKGKIRFLGHPLLGSSMSKEVLGRLRLSSRGKQMIGGIVEHHLRPTQMSQGGEMPTHRAVHRYFRDVGDVAIDTLYLSLADHLAARGPGLDLQAWERHAGMVSHILEVGTKEQSPQQMPRLIDGHDLMREFELSPGPRIGALLEEIRDAQVTGELRTREDALAWVSHNIDRSTSNQSSLHTIRDSNGSVE